MSTGVGSGAARPGAQKTWPGEPPGAGPAALTRVQGGTLPDGSAKRRGYDVESLI